MEYSDFDKVIEKVVYLTDKHEIRTKEQRKVLKWAANVLMQSQILDMIMKDEVEIVGFDRGSPTIALKSEVDKP